MSVAWCPAAAHPGHDHKGAGHEVHELPGTSVGVETLLLGAALILVTAFMARASWKRCQKAKRTDP